jgi:hypothetical protein
MSGVIHPIYLPFSEDQLKKHFIDDGTGKKSPARHVAYYTKGANHYFDHKDNLLNTF